MHKCIVCSLKRGQQHWLVIAYVVPKEYRDADSDTSRDKFGSWNKLRNEGT